jgi:hypothetical protein
MSQNVTHSKKIARALVARTGMSYTHARKLVQAGVEAGVLEPPFSDDRLPMLVDALLGSPLVAAIVTSAGPSAIAAAESASKAPSAPHSIDAELQSARDGEVIDWSQVARARFPETGDRWWTVRARHGHFVVLTQQVPFKKKGVLRYTVVDQSRGVRGPVNTIGQGWSGIETDRGCKVLARAMSLGMREVSHRNNVPIEATDIEWTKPVEQVRAVLPEVSVDDVLGDPVRAGEALAAGAVRGGQMARRDVVAALEAGRDLSSHGGRSVYEVTTHDVAGMLRRTAVLVRSGLPMPACLDLASRSAKAPVLRAAMADVAVLLKGGWRLHEAFGAYPVLFDDFVVASVFAGEQSGQIETLMVSAAETIVAEKPYTLVSTRYSETPLPRGDRKSMSLNV